MSSAGAAAAAAKGKNKNNKKRAGSAGGACHGLIVSDDGRGMSRDDLGVAAVRHATSKLRTCRDFDTLETFGFRGEALAAVSMVSRMTICSKARRKVPQRQQQQQAAYRQTYRDGQPVWSQPQPCARQPGTTVTVQDLFYNVPHRRSSLKAADEYNRILAVAQQYAILTASRGVGISCRKVVSGSTGGGGVGGGAGQHRTDLNTTSLSSVQAVRSALQREEHRGRGSGSDGNGNGNGNADVSSENDCGSGCQDDDDKKNKNDGKQQLLRSLREEATKQVIGQVFGSQIMSQLRPFESRLSLLRRCDQPKDNNNNNNNKGGDDSMDDSMTGRKGVPQGEQQMIQTTTNGTTTTDDDRRQPAEKREQSQEQQCSYSAMGFFSAPVFQATSGGSGGGRSSGSSGNYGGASISSGKRTRFVLFVNGRLVDSNALKRAVENAYGEFTKSKPFVYMSLTVPARQVDVNVHPTKREVALLHLEEIARRVSESLREALSAEGQSFQRQHLPKAGAAGLAAGNSGSIQMKLNPYSKSSSSSSSSNKKRKRGNDDDDEDYEEDDDGTTEDGDYKKKDDTVTNISQSNGKKKKKKDTGSASSKLIRTTRSTQAGTLEPFLVHTQRSQTKQLPAAEDDNDDNGDAAMTTAAAAAAASATVSVAAASSSTSGTQQKQQRRRQQQHKDDCPLSKTAASTLGAAADLSQPGAFAKIASTCRCFNRQEDSGSSSGSMMVVRTQQQQQQQSMLPPQQGLLAVRPKKVIPTACTYKSIVKLRKWAFEKNACAALQNTLRASSYVGCVSEERSLLQCGQDLCLVHHAALAAELFYQLALLKFEGGATRATFDPVDVERVVREAIQIEYEMQQQQQQQQEQEQEQEHEQQQEPDGTTKNDANLSGSSSTNDGTTTAGTTAAVEGPTTTANNRAAAAAAAAKQAAKRLLDHAEMLRECFSITIEKTTTSTTSSSTGTAAVADGHYDRIVLTGLPVLLDGHVPVRHGLPVFLLRLANDVDWSKERACFHGICKELGNYYARLPSFGTAAAADDDATDETTTTKTAATTAAAAAGTRRRRTPSPRRKKDNAILASYVQHVVFPAVTTLLVPSQRLQEEQAVVALTDLEKLYKVFERC